MASVQCYGVKGNNPLAKLIEAQKTKRPSTFREQISNAEYSPVFIGSQDGLKEADKIESLPGQPDGATFDRSIPCLCFYFFDLIAIDIILKYN